jgi:hypothetical protein
MYSPARAASAGAAAARPLNCRTSVEGIEMRVPGYLIATCLLALALSPAVPATADVPETWDGLVQVKAKRLEAVYVMPGADFSGYRKVMIDPAEVAFNKNWSKEMQRDPARRISDADARKIASTAQSGFDEVFAEAFGEAGHEVVTAPGPDVLRLSPGIANLYINAPDVRSSAVARQYVVSAGEATLVLEVRDSVTGALLARAVDRRETRRSAAPTISSSVTNKADFMRLFEQWAGITVKGFEDIVELGQVPGDLKPKQKL